MESSDLRVFEAVLRHGNMKRAAEELNTVQSNITARIKVLETALGLPLFERHARGVTPTAAGERMRPFAQQMMKLLADAAAAARDEGPPRGPLRLGSLETTTALRLSPLLGNFAVAHPAVQLAITTGTTSELVHAVVECRLDGAFVAGPLTHKALRQEVMLYEELVLVTAPPISSIDQLAMQEEVKTIVFREGCSYRQRLETVLAGVGIVTAQPLIFGSLDAIIACVGAGAGVTLLPRAVVADAMAAGRVNAHALPPDQGRVETLFIQRREGYVSRALAAFIGLARSQVSPSVAS